MLSVRVVAPVGLAVGCDVCVASGNRSPDLVEDTHPHVTPQWRKRHKAVEPNMSKIGNVKRIRVNTAVNHNYIMPLSVSQHIKNEEK